VPLTARMPEVLARILVVFFTIGVRSNDHMRRVLAVVCGEHSSENPGTVFSHFARPCPTFLSIFPFPRRIHDHSVVSAPTPGYHPEPHNSLFSPKPLWRPTFSRASALYPR
jgi:hypothetical protein